MEHGVFAFIRRRNPRFYCEAMGWELWAPALERLKVLVYAELATCAVAQRKAAFSAMRPGFPHFG